MVALVGEHAQDLALRRQRHVRDLVEEQGAPVGMLEQARAADALGLAAEQFLLDPVGAHHRRREDDERGLRAQAPLMDHSGRDFLADSGRARNQHPAPGRGDALEGRADGVDENRAAVELVLVADLRLERHILATQAVGLGRPSDEIDQPLRLERLLDEVDRPFPHRGDGGVEIAMAGDHQHRDGGIAALDLLQQLQAVETRALQPDVEQHHRWPALLDRVESRIAVGRGAHGIAFVLEHPAHQLADVGLVVHHQHFKRHYSPPSPSSLSSSPGGGASAVSSAASLSLSNAIRT